MELFVKIVNCLSLQLFLHKNKYLLGSYIRPWILKNILKICSRSPIANPRLLNIHIKSTAKKVWTLFCFHFSFAFSYMGKPSFKELNFTDPYAIFLSSVKISQMISSRHNFYLKFHWRYPTLFTVTFEQDICLAFCSFLILVMLSATC